MSRYMAFGSVELFSISNCYYNLFSYGRVNNGHSRANPLHLYLRNITYGRQKSQLFQHFAYELGIGGIVGIDVRNEGTVARRRIAVHFETEEYAIATLLKLPTEHMATYALLTTAKPELARAPHTPPPPPPRRPEPRVVAPPHRIPKPPPSPPPTRLLPATMSDAVVRAKLVELLRVRLESIQGAHYQHPCVYACRVIIMFREHVLRDSPTHMSIPSTCNSYTCSARE